MKPLHHPAARLLSGAFAALLAAGVVAGTASPALAAAPQNRGQLTYIALGDSYAAGQGGGAPLNMCNQTANGYPALLDAERGITLLRNATCAGSATGDVIGDQTDELIRGIKLVTVTVGGNDLDFLGLAAACAADFTSPTCTAAVAARQAQLPELAVELLATYHAIATAAPRATILVTGYPVLVDVPSIATATAAFNETIRSVVEQVADEGVDIRYVDVASRFEGHGLGTADPWIVQPGGTDGLHPTAAGYRAYRAALLAAL